MLKISIIIYVLLTIVKTQQAVANNNDNLISELTFGSSGNCISNPNTYWTGFQCLCTVGYIKINGLCTYYDYKKYPNSYVLLVPQLIYTSNPNGTIYPNPSPNPNPPFPSPGCNINQIYNQQLRRCECISGLVLWNGFCQTCPFNYQVFNNGCILCPSNSIYNPTTKQCNCPTNWIRNYQLNLCNKCQVNEIISNNQCVCKPGYIKNEGLVCVLNCGPNKFLYLGQCIQCPFNKIYNPAINQCVCQIDYRQNSQGICQLSSSLCTIGMYRDPIINQCLSCPTLCSSCESLIKCTACKNIGYKPQNGICVQICGDGIIVGNQQCDDSNQINNDGCSFICKVESGFQCLGSPSICIKNNSTANCSDGVISGNQTCDDRNVISGDGCSFNCTVEAGYQCSGVPSICIAENSTGATLTLVGNISTNAQNVFIGLKTNPVFNFTNPDEMKNFIKYQFPLPETSSPTVFCNQNYADISIFNCLIIYPAGVPNRPYPIIFYFNKDGKFARVSVNVDPLSTTFGLGSLR